MKLKAKLQIYALITVSVSLILFAFLILIFQKIRITQNNTKNVDNIIIEIIDIDHKVHNYHLDITSSNVTEWLAQLESADKLIDQHKIISVDENDAIYRLKNINSEIIRIITDNTNQIRIHADNKELFTRTIFLNTEKYIHELFDLKLIIRKQRDSGLAQGAFVVFLFTSILTSLMLGIIFFINKGIAIPIVKLSDTMNQFTVDKNIKPQQQFLNLKDEIGTLYRAFNEMINKLNAHHQDLEQQIKEKTKQLNAKLEELEEFNKLMIGRELKMIELKKEIEKLKIQND